MAGEQFWNYRLWLQSGPIMIFTSSYYHPKYLPISCCQSGIPTLWMQRSETHSLFSADLMLLWEAKLQECEWKHRSRENICIRLSGHQSQQRQRRRAGIPPACWGGDTCWVSFLLSRWKLHILPQFQHCFSSILSTPVVALMGPISLGFCCCCLFLVYFYCVPCDLRNIVDPTLSHALYSSWKSPFPDSSWQELLLSRPFPLFPDSQHFSPLSNPWDLLQLSGMS